ncbi:MAG: hypothetical protein WBL23_04015 [Salinisphaera sp.]|uniref:acetyltransferase n=1 Tax=Salinisphaera sp. TaxID=1914330 RepID=UPI003C79EF8F
MSDDLELRMAERVRSACVEAARLGYEDAAMSGLCGEGALEAAIGAIEKLDLRELLPVPRTMDEKER